MSPPPEEVLRVRVYEYLSKAEGAKVSQRRVSTSPQKQRTPGKAVRKIQELAAKRKRVHSVILEKHSPSPTGQSRDTNFASSSRITIDATPNPKPRKQSKRNVAFTADPATPTASPTKASRARASASPTKASTLQSPHASNSNADYIPPLHEGSRHSVARQRSMPPSPRYEPPSERFTPPREVLYTPVLSVSKSSKRKSIPWSRTKQENGKGNERRLTIQIKKEPPEIDLTEPLPPASPTDDPLLLHGPPPSSKRKKAVRSSLGMVSMYSRDTPPISSSSPVLRPVEDGTMLLDVNMTGMDMAMTSSDAPEVSNIEDMLPPLFDFHDDGADSLSEGEAEAGQNYTLEDQEEFAEQYKIVAVPTKADPPSSVTRERQDRWGRPVSPFPYEARQDLDPANEADEDIVDALLSSPHFAAAALDDTSDHQPPPSASPTSSLPSSPIRASAFPTLRTPATSNNGENMAPQFDQEPPEHPRYEEYSRQLSQGHETIIEFDVPLAGDEDEQSFALEDTPTRPTFFLPEELRNARKPGPSDLSWSSHLSTDNDTPAESLTAAKEACPVDDFDELYADPDPPLHNIERGDQHPPGDILTPSQPETGLNDDETVDEEDAASVVRELSHEPDLRDVQDDDIADTNSWRLPDLPNKAFQVMTSPHNPFHIRSPTTGDLTASSTNGRSSRRLDIEWTETREPDDDSDLADLDLGVVKITSEDPMAAARAAAILRLVSLILRRTSSEFLNCFLQHKYDCIDIPSSKNPRPSLRETVLKNARRKSVMQSGILKMASTMRRRQTIRSVIGDNVDRTEDHAAD